MNPNLTYVLAVVAGLGAVAAYFLGWLDAAQATQLFYTALGIFGIRAAVNNVGLAGGVGKQNIW